MSKRSEGRKADFSQKTKRILASRAGYICSFPDCNKLTIGPGVVNEEAACTGEAAHIYSSSDLGPRGSGRLSALTRSSPKNGIWLCAYHARLVDTNRGEHYLPGTLLRYKYRHEARIAMKQGHWPLGWIDELQILKNTVFVDGSTLRLGKVTLLVGGNGSGKTFLFRLLNSLSKDIRHNLGSVFLDHEELAYSVRLKDPEPHEVRVEGFKKDIDVYLDGNRVPFIPLTVDVYFQEQERGLNSLERFLEIKRLAFDGEYNRLDDLELLSEYWKISPDLVKKLVSKAGTFVSHAFDDARFISDNGMNRLLVNDKRWRPDASIHKISGGMLEMLSLDAALCRACLMSDYLPTLMLLHTAYLHLDFTHMGLYVDFLTSRDVRFQTLIATPDPRWAKLDIPWEIVHLTRREGRTVLEQQY